MINYHMSNFIIIKAADILRELWNISVFSRDTNDDNDESRISSATLECQRARLQDRVQELG